MKRTAVTKQTGRMNVYLCYDLNFFERRRPAYDTAADSIGELTEEEASRLRSLIARFINRCHKKHGSLKLEAAVSRGQHS